MWRRAHGRLAAIVVVAGGLLACATAPKPAENDDDDHRFRMHCGHRLHLDPQQFVVAIAEGARKSCASGAAAAGRYGEFRAVLRANDGREPFLDLEPNGTLNEEDQRCVQLAAGEVRWSLAKAWRHEPDVWVDVSEDIVFSFAIGSPVPIPSARRIVDDPEWPRSSRQRPTSRPR
jgi:hypothetical protein